ncbi:hypothetical protein OAH18_01595 [bacterium]|nr:hypothetical protein [bacterium]
MEHMLKQYRHILIRNRFRHPEVRIHLVQHTLVQQEHMKEQLEHMLNLSCFRHRQNQHHLAGR